LADRFPVLWRRLAIELADRVRQWTGRVLPRNEHPILFIGSSSESVPEATAIAEGLSAEPIEIRLWTDGVFRPSFGTMESLEVAIPSADFAALLLMPNDLVEIRGKRLFQPRDNVVFELGLAMGALGRKRALMIVPHGVDIRLPTDLDGLTLLKFDPREDITRRFNSVIEKVVKCIATLGTK
jgi:predicted nucleotide-binding protein